MLNTTLLNAANKVMSNTSPAQFTISARFISSATSTSDSPFSFYPMIIENMVIDRDYLVNYADVITMHMKVSLKDYALMQDQGENLLCVLTTTYVDKYGKTVFTPAPIRRQYNVLIQDPRDIRKAVPDIQNYREPTHDMVVQLVEPTIYKLRHTKINTVYQNATLTQAIHAITQSFGIEKVQLAALENSQQYDHISIAGYQSIASIFGYLQKNFGLYTKGACAYITNGVLYVYPPFDTTATYDKTALFYQVDTGRYSGSHIFHQVNGTNISIVVNSQPDSRDLSVAGSENVGTGFIFNRASRMTDGITAIDSKQGAVFTEQPALSVSLASARAVVGDSHNIMHIPSTDNPFPQMSKIIAHQASLMEMRWENADPFQIDPGHAVSYFYDHNETMVKKSGIVEHAKFTISRMQRKDSLDMFGAVGTLMLRLSPNETQVL